MNWLRKRREELDLSQEEVAAQLQLEGIDVTRGTVSNWETGRHKPPLDDEKFRQSFAKVMKLSVREVLKLSGYEIVQVSHTDAGERGAFIIDELPPEKQDLAIRLLEQLQR